MQNMKNIHLFLGVFVLVVLAPIYASLQTRREFVMSCVTYVDQNASSGCHNSVIITTLYQLMLQSWYQKTAQSGIGEHVGIIFVTL